MKRREKEIRAREEGKRGQEEEGGAEEEEEEEEGDRRIRRKSCTLSPETFVLKLYSTPSAAALSRQPASRQPASVNRDLLLPVSRCSAHLRLLVTDYQPAAGLMYTESLFPVLDVQGPVNSELLWLPFQASAVVSR